MLTIQLTHEEQEALIDVLRRHLASLEVEIIHCDHREFKDLLKTRQAVVSRLIDKAGAAATTAPA